MVYINSEYRSRIYFLAVVTQIHVIESKPSKSSVTELSFFVNVKH